MLARMAVWSAILNWAAVSPAIINYTPIGVAGAIKTELRCLIHRRHIMACNRKGGLLQTMATFPREITDCASRRSH